MAETNGGTRTGGRSLALIAGLGREGANLLRQQVSLARQETIEKVAPAVRAVAFIVGGGALSAIGGVYLLQTVVRALATRMPMWLASLITGGTLTLGGVLLAGLGGRQLRKLDIVPKKTIQSLKENREWLLRQIRSRMI